MLEQEIIKAYASLPSSPILSSAGLETRPPGPFGPTTHFGTDVPRKDSSAGTAPPFSLWEYLREELLATDFDSHQELKWERVSNFLSIPIGVEKV